MHFKLFFLSIFWTLSIFSPAHLLAACDPVDWTGLYVGLNSGGCWGSARTRTSATFDPGLYFSAGNVPAVNSAGRIHVPLAGYTGGAQVGYNRQFRRMIVGLESDFGAFLFDYKKNVTAPYPVSSLPTTFTISQHITTNWLFTLRPRLGFTFKKTLAFVSGGLSLTELKYRSHFTDDFTSTFVPGFPNVFESSRKTRILPGWIVSGGLEYWLSGRASICLSYFYTRFSKISSTGNIIVPSVSPPVVSNLMHHRAQLHANILRIGVNFRL
jgi:outer membrane immunogenic protein